MNIIDLRSDTVTKPGKDMLKAMLEAAVGDDVFNEDPSVNSLEERSAALFGMEAALFCPSGTMANQLAVKIHTRPLDEIMLHPFSHIYTAESSGYAFTSGVGIRFLSGERGLVDPEDIVRNIQADLDWVPVSRLVCIENTCNKGGGSIYPLEQLKSISAICRKHNLALHMDGARIFNAFAGSNYTAADLHGLFDSIAFCFSKGLGAPVGSVLCGNRAFIKEARRFRKVLGGGMRQAGILAAACHYALDHHIELLSEDHQKALNLSAAIAETRFVQAVIPVESNIVLFTLKEEYPLADFLQRLSSIGIRAVAFGPQTVRMVCHMDIPFSQIEEAIERIGKL